MNYIPYFTQRDYEHSTSLLLRINLRSYYRIIAKTNESLWKN